MERDQIMVKLSHSDTLLNRCLRILANNFVKMEANKLAVLPRNLNANFLKVISKRGYITDENIQIFLNEQIRILELSECLTLSDKGISKLIICKNLVKLDLNSNNSPRTSISAESLSNIGRSCKNLKIILLRRCVNVNDLCIDIIASNCSQLNTLNIGNCPLISDKALFSLGKYCKFLKSINISGTKITDNGIFSLMSENLSKKIEEIHIAHCDLITDEMTDASRLALEDYMTNNSNQRFQHLTWTIY